MTYRDHVRDLLARIEMPEGQEVKTMGPFWSGHRSEDGKIRGAQAIWVLECVIDELLSQVEWLEKK